MRVVHHHYSSGIDQWNDREGDREEVNNRGWEGKIFFESWDEKEEELNTFQQYSDCFDLDKYGV